MNKHTTSTIANDDNSIDKHNNHNSTKTEVTSAKSKTTAIDEKKIFNLWNWRIETDTAELFVGMFG